MSDYCRQFYVIGRTLLLNFHGQNTVLSKQFSNDRSLQMLSYWYWEQWRLIVYVVINISNIHLPQFFLVKMLFVKKLSNDRLQQMFSCWIWEHWNLIFIQQSIVQLPLTYTACVSKGLFILTFFLWQIRADVFLYYICHPTQRETRLSFFAISLIPKYKP